MKKVYIGILGLGTVGSAVANTLKANGAAIAERTGVQIVVKKVCDIKRVSSPFSFTSDPYSLISDPQISVIVETIGGINPAKKYVLTAIKAGKSVVTSNKELIALHMAEILKAAESKGVAVLFEGAVGGGIPLLNTLRDNLSANQIEELYGIVNGTTNYLLSKMTEEGLEFPEALIKAKEKGFAEADPRLDIEGYDASYKAVILAAVAFQAKVRWQDVYRQGIEKVSAEDILYAGDIGYVIKLLAILKNTAGRLEVRVHPALVAKTHPLASVSSNFNAIYVKGQPVGELMFYGPGAGGKPTASAVIGDVIACANVKCQMSNVKLRTISVRKIEEITSRYYLRLQAPDRPGVLAAISRSFAHQKVSIAAVTQKETKGKTATIIILVHETAEKNLRAALTAIQKTAAVRKIGNVIRIL